MKDFTLIAGPCVIESRQLTLDIAKELQVLAKKLHINFIFKASFDKANRSSLWSYRGPGIELGLDILKQVSNLGIKVTTDVHTPDQAKPVAEIVDVLQIPAFLCRQTDLLLACAKTHKPVNVKKGQFMAPMAMNSVIEKLKWGGCKDITITERGTAFGYGDLIVDFRSLVLMRNLGVKVCFDATHSVQQPPTGSESTQGTRDLVPYLAKAAAAVGTNTFFMEVHPDPAKALCDASNVYYLKDLDQLLKELVEIWELVN